MWNTTPGGTHEFFPSVDAGERLEPWEQQWLEEQEKWEQEQQEREHVTRAYMWLAQKVEEGHRQFDQQEWAMILKALRHEAAGTTEKE